MGCQSSSLIGAPSNYIIDPSVVRPQESRFPLGGCEYPDVVLSVRNLDVFDRFRRLYHFCDSLLRLRNALGSSLLSFSSSCVNGHSKEYGSQSSGCFRGWLACGGRRLDQVFQRGGIQYVDGEDPSFDAAHPPAAPVEGPTCARVFTMTAMSAHHVLASVGCALTSARSPLSFLVCVLNSFMFVRSSSLLAQSPMLLASASSSLALSSSNAACRTPFLEST